MELMTLDEHIKKAEEDAAQAESDSDWGLGKYFLDPTEAQEYAENCRQLAKWLKDYKRLLEQESCEDAISRQAVINVIERWSECSGYNEAERHIMRAVQSVLYDSPSVNPQSKTGHCKDCKYFEYDSVAKMDGIPLIVAHEICSRWGGGCKTREDGYCFLFEPQESGDEE